MFDSIRKKIRENPMYQNAINKRDSGEMKFGGVAVALIIVVIVIVIAVTLVPTIFSALSTATSNTTLASNPHYTTTFSLIYLIPLVFVAGILVLVLVLMFEKME